MLVHQKDLVLLAYPFSDLQGAKVRPAIVISNDAFNAKSDDCVMIPLTTVMKNEPYSVIIGQQDLRTGRLLKPSRVRADKIFTVEKNLVQMKIGTITNRTFEVIKLEISKIF